jgi:hypothetical protein
MTPFKWFAVSSAIAIVAVILFFQVNSYGADKNNLNGFFKVAGAVVLLVAGAIMYFKVAKKSN